MSGGDPIRGQIQGPTPTLRELAMVLFRRRRVFICASTLALAAAVLYACAGTQYRAIMKVLVRRGRADAPVSAGVNAPLDLTRMAVTEEELNSEVELLHDDDVLRRVVEETGMSSHDWLGFLRFGEGPAQRVERTARQLRGRLEAQSLKKTNLIAVSYASGDPETAAKVLQSLAKAYLEKHMAVHRPNGEFDFLEQQTEKSKQQLEESKQRLLKFTAARQVAAASQQRDLARQVRRNLWIVPMAEGEPRTTAFLHTYLGEVRREFEYSIVESQSAGASNEAVAMAHCADGIILVLSALRTRRAAAGKIRQTFEEAQVRLLGTVLSDREFPIPEGVYRRL